MRKKEEQRKMFRNIFFGIFLSMFIVTLVALLSVYRIAKDIIVEQGLNLSVQAFSRVQAEFEEANSDANRMATQIMMDDVCSEFINTVSRSQMDSLRLNSVRKQLSLYEYTNQNVDSIYIYNSKADLFVTTGTRYGVVGKEQFFDQDIVEILEHPENYNLDSLIQRQQIYLYLMNDSRNYQTVYSYIKYPSVSWHESAVIINFRMDDMLRQIIPEGFLKDSNLSIRDSMGNILLEQNTLDLTMSPELDAVLTGMRSKGDTVQEYRSGGQRYVIFSLTSGDGRWIYTKISKWETVFQRILEFRKRMTWFIVIIFGIAGLIALFNVISLQRVQRHWENIIMSRAGENRLMLPDLREHFLINFLRGRKEYDKSTIFKRMEEYNFPLQEDEEYTLLILEIAGYRKFLETFDEGMIYDIKWGFSNVFEETFSPCGRIQGVLDGEKTMTFLVGGHPDRETAETLFREFLKNVTLFVPWDFILYWTDTAVLFENLPDLHTKMMDVCSEGFFYPPGSCLDIEELQKEHGEGIDFQVLQYQELLMSGSAKTDPPKAYQELKKKIIHYRMEDYKNVLIWFSIYLFRNIRSHITGETEGNEFLVKLVEAERETETDGYFRELFARITQKQKDELPNNKVSQRLREVEAYIDEHFQDQTLNLDSIGDVFGISPGYLGRMFKKQTGISISEYINEKRLEWVKEQLKLTNEPVKDIAEKAGFIRGNYFYTYFRKKVGLTPQAYREQCRMTYL